MDKVITGAAIAMSEADALERRTLDKVTWRLVPILAVCLFIAILDRVNIGFANAAMSKDLALSAAAFGGAAGIFFIGYFFFEVPSNLALNKFGARVWIARIMFTWGIISAAQAFVVGETSLNIVRFLLGVAEAGLFSRHHLFPDLVVSIGVSRAHCRPVHGCSPSLNRDRVADFRRHPRYGGHRRLAWLAMVILDRSVTGPAYELCDPPLFDRSTGVGNLA